MRWVFIVCPCALGSPFTATTYTYSVVVKGADAVPNPKSWFVISGDAATKLAIFACPGHLTIKQGVDGAANVEGGPVGVEP